MLTRHRTHRLSQIVRLAGHHTHRSFRSSRSQTGLHTHRSSRSSLTGHHSPHTHSSSWSSLRSSCSSHSQVLTVLTLTGHICGWCIYVHSHCWVFCSILLFAFLTFLILYYLYSCLLLTSAPVLRLRLLLGTKHKCYYYHGPHTRSSSHSHRSSRSSHSRVLPLSGHHAYMLLSLCFSFVSRKPLVCPCVSRAAD